MTVRTVFVYRSMRTMSLQSMGIISILCATLFSKEMLPLGGGRWRKLWKAVARLLLVLLLVPYGSGAFLLAGREGPGCGMPCCKGSKVCSCRRSDKHGRRDGPGWIAASKCPEGCGQLPAVSRAAAASLVAAWVRVSPVVSVSHVRIAALSPRVSSETRFALFERPPPYV
jgi:hypothetical protein